MASLPTMTMQEVAKHNTKEDCWLVIHGKAYDLTKFARAHPGGSKLIYENAGMDATAPFDHTHPKDIMDRLLKPEMTKCIVDPATITAEYIAKPPAPKPKAPKKKVAPAGGGPVEPVEFVKPSMMAMLNTFDFESVAREVMEEQAWGYYSSGGDDEITLRDNFLAFQRIVMRPRILINVKDIDLSTKVMGAPMSIPVYFTATALAKLADPAGECGIVRAAHKAGTVYMLPTLSSHTLDDMLAARVPGQHNWAQLYVNSEREKTEQYVKKLEENGVTALFVTVDAPQLGRREKDMRLKFTEQGSDVQAQEEEDGVDRSQGAARAISSFIDPALCWDDVPWLKRITKMKVLLKGVQCGEDAVRAYRAGLDGCVLSNHGGRQLDTCRAGIEVLPEVIDAIRDAGAKPGEDFDVMVDGGVRRGQDIFKAIALGASCVGMGRPVLYALASYGEKGITRMVDLLRDELQMVMRLAGTPSIKDITRNRVDIHNLADHIVPQPTNWLATTTYQPLVPAARI
eukprot:TRINITY_DN2530_c0_g2_i1.p1 TRINITY_DN2530_c0_g2~~TRINITY_DN2530_c0_g2_i1.p1  ORF type:complete len:513 (-),score=152.97 TRINITY_DN2530_c0_g2_i1:509-2047(-)